MEGCAMTTCPVFSAAQSAFPAHTDNWQLRTTSRPVGEPEQSWPPVPPAQRVPARPPPCFPPLQKSNHLSYSTNTCLCVIPWGRDWEGSGIILPVSHIPGTADSTTNVLRIVQSYGFSPSPPLARLPRFLNTANEAEEVRKAAVMCGKLK